jgi:hypothetical protein
MLYSILTKNLLKINLGNSYFLRYLPHPLSVYLWTSWHYAILPITFLHYLTVWILISTYHYKTIPLLSIPRERMLGTLKVLTHSWRKSKLIWPKSNLIRQNFNFKTSIHFYSSGQKFYEHFKKKILKIKPEKSFSLPTNLKWTDKKSLSRCLSDCNINFIIYWLYYTFYY